ncbi:type III secretion system chaperone [Acanthopleuribacter pedis]|uniref:Type III secretion system chaperone n=1 Tax=Acanthopleuribacter pedis TaxID=442870 RepID=A0A8J7U572_9BACT|nr:type III secretion system chaperone [Acanthopleuribacter pedis]MBO1321422.1 type III secretion system chaperone [Acanthopleuribacter pedis]
MIEDTTPTNGDPLAPLVAAFAERAGIEPPEADADHCYGLLFNQTTAVYLRSEPDRDRIALFTPFPDITDDDTGSTWRRLLHFNATERATHLRFALEPRTKTPVLILERPAEGCTTDDLENALDELLDAVARTHQPWFDQTGPTETLAAEPGPEEPSPADEHLAPPSPSLLA